MKWQVIQPPTDLLLSVDDVMVQLRTATSDEAPYLQTLIAAATAHAEELMECSLLTRTIQATYYAHDRMYLPRGPVQSIVNVTVNGAVQNPGTYSVEGFGHNDLLRYNNSTHQPFAAPITLVCTYVTGYGDASDVPADILQVIRCHIGMLYENRELVAERTITPVPFISEFYKLRGRGTGVG